MATPPTRRSLATAQTLPVRGDVAENLARHRVAVEAAIEEGAEVCLFPELSLTGYEPSLARELAFTPEDSRLSPLRSLAQEGRIRIVVGAPLLLEDRLHIAQFAIGPDGELVHYTKRRLGAFPRSAAPGGLVPTPEPEVFAPGDRDPLLVFPQHDAALAICADTADRDHPARAAARGATTYLASMFFTPREREAEERRLESYARTHSLAICLANFGGPSGGLEAGGGSAIWAPGGELLVQLAGRGAALAVAREKRRGRGAGSHWQVMTRLLEDPPST